MSANKLKVFSASWCTNCKPYKLYLKNLGIEFEEIDVESEEGAKLATQFSVRSLPTSIVEGADGETVFMGVGTGAIDRVKELML